MSSRKVKFRSSAKNKNHQPAKVDEFEVFIRDLTSDGRGVGEAPDGQVIFVAGVWVGETALVRRTRQGKAIDTRLVDVLQPHEQRVLPHCEYHAQRKCGGCPWMFMDYDAQLTAKKERLASSLVSLGANEIRSDIIGSSSKLGYRNRAQFKTNGEVLGYLATGSHELVDVANCPILTKENQAQLNHLRRELPCRAWRPNSREKWVTLDIDDRRKQALVNQRQAFRQANDTQNNVMREWLSDALASVAPVASVVELFCGSGNLTEVISKQRPSARITAVEGDGLALKELDSLTLSNVTTVQTNLFQKTQSTLFLNSLPAVSGVVLDPPRDGLKEREALVPLFSKSPWVVYISCNLATWQRDARFLRDQGLRLAQCQGLDMFPQTPHLEVLSVFERQ